MKITIDIPDSQAQQLDKAAIRLGVNSEELARAAVTDILSFSENDFLSAAKKVLVKNKELYKRLA